MRKKRSSNTKATPQGEPPALWMAPGSDPGIGMLNGLPAESQCTEMIRIKGEMTSNLCSISDAVAITAS